MATRQRRHQNQRLLKALVLKWDSQKIIVRCPYCLYAHEHAFASDFDETIELNEQGWKSRLCGTRRRSDCSDAELGGDYTFLFPDMGEAASQGYGWEFDQESHRFVAVNHLGQIPVLRNDGQDGRSRFPQCQERQETSEIDDAGSETSSLVDATRGLHLDPSTSEHNISSSPTGNDGDLYKDLMLDPSYRHDLYISYCVENNSSTISFSMLQTLCRRYPEDGLIGSIDEEGNNGALLAATEEHGLHKVRWLHSQGDSINQANHYGRTPLMEAALWGRLNTVRYLVEQEVELQARDGNDMRALDFADETARNTKERQVRCVIYREAPDAAWRRKQIKSLLQQSSSPTANTDTPGTPMLRRCAFFNRKDNGTLEVYRPQAFLQPPSGQYGLEKAFATLDRGPLHPYINAMSGFSHSGWPNVLDNSAWTDKAEALRGILELPANRRAASHVEAQLLAYLIDRHSIYALTDKDESTQLRNVMPKYALRPIITVSKRDFCPFCRMLVLEFRSKFPLIHVTLHCVGDSALNVLDTL